MMLCLHCHLLIYFGSRGILGIDQAFATVLEALSEPNSGLEAILSRECFPDLVIGIKYATFDCNRVTISAFKCGHRPLPFHHTHRYTFIPHLKKRQALRILMQKRVKRTKNWIEFLLFQFPLLASCCISPRFFSPVFFKMNFMIFSSALLSTSPSFYLTPRQFSPDRFHSVLEGMDLIALWGLAGCAGLGCLISVPCRDWFNASWSWNCLIVQPSGDSSYVGQQV